MVRTRARRHPPHEQNADVPKRGRSIRAPRSCVASGETRALTRPACGQVKDLVRHLLRWYAREARDLPWRRTSDPYAIWIAEIMLQQTQVQTVIPYWERWLHKYPTVQALAAAKLPAVLKGWEGLGYYSRARNLYQAARLIVTQFQGRLPDRYADLLSLPGIGRYTAGAICSIAFNQPVPVLDGNVIRVLTRLFGINQNPRQAAVNKHLWKMAEDLVVQASQVKVKGRRSCADLNQSLMELGAVICTPRQPQCRACPLGRICLAGRQGNPEQYPAGKSKVPLTRLQWSCFLVQCQGRYLVRQRPRRTVNAELWEFPTAELAGLPEADVAAAARTALGFVPPGIHFAGAFRHHITRYQILVRVYRVAVSNPSRFERQGQWLELAELIQRPLAGAHKKIFQRHLCASG